MTSPQRLGELGIGFDEVIRSVRRRFWWFAVPAALGTLTKAALVSVSILFSAGWVT